MLPEATGGARASRPAIAPTSRRDHDARLNRAVPPRPKNGDAEDGRSRRATHAHLHRVGHPRDDPRRQGARRGDLAQGFPDFPAPELLKEAAAAAIRADVNQYAITWGAVSLRQALARKYATLYDMHVDPEREITVTCGATEAMAAVMLALIDPGDEVVILEPFYENYGPTPSSAPRARSS